MAEYSVHMKRKCPIVFIVTDNQMCISLKDNGWVKQVHMPMIPVNFVFKRIVHVRV